MVFELGLEFFDLEVTVFELGLEFFELEVKIVLNSKEILAVFNIQIFKIISTTDRE